MNRDNIHAACSAGATTDELIAHFTRHTDLPADELARVIPLAIDAVYAARDQRGTMHHAGACAAVAVLEALHA